MINSNIAMGAQPVQIENPMNQLAKMMQIKQAMQESEMGQMKMDEYGRTKERSNRLLGLMQGMPADATDDQRMSTLKNGGFFDEADKLNTGVINRRKNEADAAGKDVDTQVKMMDFWSNTIGRETDPARLRSQIAIMHSDPRMANTPISKVPLDQVLAQIGDTPEALKAWTDKFSLGAAEFVKRNTRTADNIATTNQSNTNSLRTAKTAANGQAITVRGQDKEDQREKNRLSLSQPKVEKMTEDQGKATGWLVQAENAFKNMMAVGVDKDGNPTSAAKPGFNDGLAAIPSFGLTGAIANTFRGADRQKFMQSTSSLSEALLRAATGAGVNKEEALQKVQELTPVFGESGETTKQKYAAIPLYIESLKVRAGPGAKKAETVLNPSAEQTSSGFKYLGKAE